MKVAVVTGSGGLIGSESVRFFSKYFSYIVGLDNDSRRLFFGDEASTQWSTESLKSEIENFRHEPIDVCDKTSIDKLFNRYGNDIALVIHTAAQPSHDWAASNPTLDFQVNANATLNLLEATRKFSEKAVFIHCSTNKVYGDNPNLLPLVETEFRWEIENAHPFSKNGINESMSVDATMHSLFGASKLAADILVQEYGRYFGMKTAVFRGGCLSGPLHSGTKLHGFLSYLIKSALVKRPYVVLGYKGKQVRDNIHSFDLVSMFWEFFKNPKSGEVYNAGGSRFSNCSILEAISLIETITNSKMQVEYIDSPRRGDHIWYISDISKFKRDYPNWRYKFSLTEIVEQSINHINSRMTNSDFA